MENKIQKKMKQMLTYISCIPQETRYERIIEIITSMNIPYTEQKTICADNIVLFPGERKADNIVFMAHHDITDGSCGANNNGAAIVILLLLAEKFREHKGRCPMIVFTDREETSNSGCTAFLKEYGASLVVNMDVCGYGDKIVICDETRYNNRYAACFRKMLPDDVMEADAFPRSDGSRAWDMGFDVWNISAFTKTDALRMSDSRMSAHEKDMVRRRIPSAVSHAAHIPPELDINDCLDCVNYKIMEKIYDYLCNVKNHM